MILKIYLLLCVLINVLFLFIDHNFNQFLLFFVIKMKYFLLTTLFINISNDTSLPSYLSRTVHIPSSHSPFPLPLWGCSTTHSLTHAHMHILIYSQHRHTFTIHSHTHPERHTFIYLHTETHIHTYTNTFTHRDTHLPTLTHGHTHTKHALTQKHTKTHTET